MAIRIILFILVIMAISIIITRILVNLLNEYDRNKAILKLIGLGLFCSGSILFIVWLENMWGVVAFLCQ